MINIGVIQEMGQKGTRIEPDLRTEVEDMSKKH